MTVKLSRNTSRRKGVSYAKWGYIFIAPFFVAYILFTLTPQLLTVYNSFFENYRNGLQQIGPNYVGLKNYVKLFSPDNTGNIGILKYFSNTMILWLMCAVPQMVVALLLAVFFTSVRLKIRGQSFFKSVIYMPNLIMASSFAMLFFTLFSNVGPINQVMMQWGLRGEVFDFFSTVLSVRSMVAGMNFLMWFGNTTIVLMAGIMGIDQCIYESATLDGAGAWKTFCKITVPLLMPIIVYVVITALIGGLQMFDVPQVLTNAKGMPNRTSMTMVMYLNNFMTASKNYGMAGAVSVVLFIVSGLLSLLVYRSLSKQYK